MIPGRAGLIGVSFALETAPKSTTSKETKQHQNDLIAALVQLITLILLRDGADLSLSKRARIDGFAKDIVAPSKEAPFPNWNP